MSPLILASTSRYRRELLGRLALPFSVERPEVDETPLPNEPCESLAVRLAHAKAWAVARNHSEAWVIGSDQVAELDGRPLGKPGHVEAAKAQLRASSGHTVVFHTAFSLVRAACGSEFHGCDETRVRFRELDDEEIQRYLDAEQPFDCAGSFKCEGLGISLFAAIDNRDPTALIGLPLIDLAQTLRQAGFRLP
ncbi:MAG TPA: Maf family nucleotide pyrophosphatase [Arenimonas sp.]|nr:Maf family nucleotide pyrophosphatase [Arenimonas sp.]